MPKIFANQHDQFLLRSLESKESKLINKKSILIGLSSSGYIFPFTVYIKVNHLFFR